MAPEGGKRMRTSTFAAVVFLGTSASLVVSACGRSQPAADGTGEASEAVRNADVSITAVGGSCPDQCFFVSSGTGANITHIFVSTEECGAPVPVDPTVRCGPSLDELTAVRPDPKYEGGPCPLSIARDLWFPLTGNQSDVYCCVTPDQTAVVSLGAKAKGECVQPVSSDACCAPSTAPDAGSGGVGGCPYGDY
jgi:hypothetical protein